MEFSHSWKTNRTIPFLTWNSIVQDAKLLVEAYPLIEGDHPRQLLLPLAHEVVKSYAKARDGALADGQTKLVALFDKNLATIRQMFPELNEKTDIPNVEQAPA